MHPHLDATVLLADPAAWVAASVIVFIAAYVRATIGFGSGLIMVGLLTILFPIKLVVPVVLLLDILGSVLLGGYDARQIRWRELDWVLPGSLAGLAVGAWILHVTPAQHLTLLLGVFLLAYVLYAVWVNPERLPRIGRGWGLPLGAFGGLIGSLYGGGGPPLVAYFQMRKLDKRAFRATFQGIALVDNVIRIALYVLMGLLTLPLSGAFVLLAPAMAIGLWFGNRLHLRISEHAFLRGTLVLLAVIAGKYLLGAAV
ncbi:MAG: sulfite exporter TauE/SafE family protein [Gammaproteobacteria bacterium]